jgi:hypothetical protein
VGDRLKRSIYIGSDPREAVAWQVASSSLVRHLTAPIPIHALVLEDLRARGLYTRPTEVRDGRLWDTISGAPMSTEHAVARFLVPRLAREGWALFMDGDMLVRDDLVPLFESLDPDLAVYCVQHIHEPDRTDKMDDQVQTRYARKNWSSFVVFNVDHPANRALTPELANTAPGRDLHRFCWLPDHLIGALDPSWNFLVGHTPRRTEPKVVHFTDGVPDMPGYEHCDFADEWRAERRRQAA